MRSVLVFTLLLSITTCSNAPMFSLDSFLSRFSLQRVVERQQSAFGFDCSSYAGGGGIGTGGGASSGKGSHSHKGESFTCRIKSAGAHDFDEARFIDSLKAAVREEVIESGAEIEGEDSAKEQGFLFKYRMGEIAGSVEISGQRHREERYTV